MRTLARRIVSFLGLSTILAGAALAGAGDPKDKVTAGGWITGTPSGEQANFGVNARNPGTPSGHLNYVDHGDSLHVVSESITSYVVIDDVTREIEGACSINGVSGFTFTATLQDLGEPGTDDTFAISLSTGYSASGTLIGGNVQIHSKS